MKSSTPRDSPSRRKHSIHRRQIIEDDLDDLNDIENEIQERRQEAINKSTEQRRKSVAAPLLAGLTATQLAQHCKDCIKLATENKINVKNAFSFMLIDVMAVMAKKNDSEINKNFQVASCTLDASVKIYGYRVDAVHTDAVKMAGGVLSKEVDVELDDGQPDGTPGKEEVKKTRKKKKKLTVVNPETLNAKSEAEVLLDVVPRQNFLAMKTDGNDLLIKIPKYNDGGEMLIDSDFTCWPYDENKNEAPVFKNKEIFDPEDLRNILAEVEITSGGRFCPDYSNFEFGKNCDESDDDDLNLSQNSNHFEFDINASVQDALMDVEEEEEMTQQKRLNVPVGGYESDQEIVLPPEPLQRQTQKIAISDMKKRITINPLEYSLFDEKVFKSWAGPTYWKVRPVSKKNSGENKENEEESHQVPSKRTRKGKVKNPVGMFEVDEEVLVKHLAIRKNSTFCKSTMLNWDAYNTSFPKDVKFKSKNLFALYHIPKIIVEPKAEIDDEGELDDTDDKNNDDEEELEYCSSLIIQDEDVPRDEGPGVAETETEAEADADADADADAEAPSQIDIETWDQGNMVQVPVKVEKIAVSTFKRKKHVDIKHLKRCIWNILTESQEKVSKPIGFGDLIKVYPSRMPGTLAASLSPPMIFNALLHLTNEKCLVLTQDKTNKTDFVVSQ